MFQEERDILQSAFSHAPPFIFFSRAILIETMSIAFGMAWLWLIFRGLIASKQKTAWLLAAFVAGVLTALLKITTFIIFGSCAAVIILIASGDAKSQSSRWKSFSTVSSVGLICLGLPLGVGYAWVNFADQIKTLNPMAADFITSKALTSWNFGSWQQRVNPYFWKQIILSNLKLTIGYGYPLVLILIFSGMLRKNKRHFFWGAVFLAVYFVGPLLFSNLFYVHDYYYVASGIFLLMSLALYAEGVIDIYSERFGKWIRFLIVIPLLFSMLAFYIVHYLPRQFSIASPAQQIGDFIKRRTNKNDVIIVYGYDWSPEIPYFSERKALMQAPGSMDFEGRKMKAAFGNLSGERIGAVVVSDTLQAKDTNSILKEFSTRFGFIAKPDIKVAGASIYIRP